MNNKLCAGRNIFRRSCQGWASSEQQLPPHRGWDCWQDSGSHQEQQVASQEPVTFRPGRVRQDVGAAWVCIIYSKWWSWFMRTKFPCWFIDLGGNKCSKSNEGSLLQTDFVWINIVTNNVGFEDGVFLNIFKLLCNKCTLAGPYRGGLVQEKWKIQVCKFRLMGPLYTCVVNFFPGTEILENFVSLGFFVRLENIFRGFPLLITSQYIQCGRNK